MTNSTAIVDIRRTWDLFKVDGGIVEVRALGCSGKHKAWAGWSSGVVSGFFDDRDAFVGAVQRLDKSGKPHGIYVTLNPVNPVLLARANNRLVGLRKGDPTVEDGDILHRRWLLLDFDPARPAGISATTEELRAAVEQANRVRARLSSWGWPHSLLACSGNGAHVLYAMAAQGNVKQILEAIDGLWSSPQVKLDTAVFNLSRHAKLYGTVVRKGENMPNRPWRRSGFLEWQDES